jgi:hypothetical protein
MGNLICLAVGNLVDGYEFYGPFNDYEQATEFAEQNFRSSLGWYIIEIKSPASIDF